MLKLLLISLTLLNKSLSYIQDYNKEPIIANLEDIQKYNYLDFIEKKQDNKEKEKISDNLREIIEKIISERENKGYRFNLNYRDYDTADFLKNLNKKTVISQDNEDEKNVVSCKISCVLDSNGQKKCEENSKEKESDECEEDDTSEKNINRLHDYKFKKWSYYSGRKKDCDDRQQVRINCKSQIHEHNYKHDFDYYRRNKKFYSQKMIFNDNEDDPINCKYCHFEEKQAEKDEDTKCKKNQEKEQNKCSCNYEYEPVCVNDQEYGNYCWANCHKKDEDKIQKCKKKDSDYEKNISFDCRCGSVYEPVCGDDDKNYLNKCQANCSNVKIKKNGLCSLDIIGTELKK